MKLGFTGTRFGMTDAQKTVFANLLKEKKPTEFHHGDCIGADSDAHDIAKSLCPIVIHPPIDQTHRAHRDGHSVTILEEKSHLSRNRSIVECTDELIATPFQAEMQNFGGTWYTIKFARKKLKRVTIINPDGSLNLSEN